MTHLRRSAFCKAECAPPVSSFGAGRLATDNASRQIQELVELDLYLAVRRKGMPGETPGVRP